MQYCVEECICCSFWPPPNIFLGRWLSVIGLGGFGPALVFVLGCSLHIWQNLSWFSVILHVTEGSSLYYELITFLPDQLDQDQLDQDTNTISLEEKAKGMNINLIILL